MRTGRRWFSPLPTRNTGSACAQTSHCLRRNLGRPNKLVFLEPIHSVQRKDPRSHGGYDERAACEAIPEGLEPQTTPQLLWRLAGVHPQHPQMDRGDFVRNWMLYLLVFATSLVIVI